MEQNWNDHVLERWSGSGAPAVITAEHTWSGQELLEHSGGAARWLDEIGFTPGSVVPALVDETPAAIALTVGAAMTRRAIAPLGTRLPPADLAAALANLGATDLLADPGKLGLAGEIATLCGVRVHPVDGPQPPAPLDVVACGPDDALAVVHTSGTTGLPKPIYVRHATMLARIASYAPLIGLEAGDRYCSASPYYHTAGINMTLTVLPLGASVIPQDWFSLDNWRVAAKLGANIILLVPTMIDLLLAEGALAEASPKVLQYGASPIHPDTLAAAVAALPGTRFLQIFGQTEVSPIAALTHDDHLAALAGAGNLLTSVGRAAPGVTLRVDEPDADGIGELLVQAEHLFQRDDDGWRRSGDLGRIDANGYITLHGRTNDRIVRGGENIYPIEVEQALATHPDVLEAAVVGVPDRRLGELVKAAVVVRDPAAPPSVDALREHARARVAHFKVPAIVEFVAELPRNAAGKVLRRNISR